jgi:tetratricopeptide (TPR) repeat protein
VRRVALAPALLLSALAASCGSGPGVMFEPPPRAYSDAEALFLLKDYKAARRKFETFARSDPRSPFASRAHYWAGVSALKVGDIRDARTHIGIACARCESRFVRGLCFFSLGECDFAGGMYRSAIANYRRALKYPGAQKAGILYKVGRCYRGLGMERKAGMCFDRVASEYPDSDFAGLLGTKGDEKPGVSSDGFTVQAGVFGRRSNAEKLRARLEKRGYPAHLRLVHRAGSVLYYVRVGRYDTRKRAEAVARGMRAAGFDAVAIP